MYISIGNSIGSSSTGAIGIAAPVATAATGVGQTSFTANWNAYTGATYYLLDVSASPTFATFIYENQITTSTSYVVIGLEPNTTYYYRVRANVGFDSDAQAFFTRVTDAGGSLSTTEQDAVNTLVVQMKADGIWSKMKAIYPMVGASAAACAQNLKSSSFTGTFSSGFTFSSTGVTGNGTSSFFNTNFNPVAESLDVANCHITAYTRQDENSNSGFGRFDRTTGTNRCLAVFLYESNVAYYQIGSGVITSTPATLNKGFQMVKSFSGVGKGFLNNVQKGSDFTASGQLPNGNLWLNALDIPPFGTYYNKKECAFASIGDGLTDTEAFDFYTEVQRFQTTLNRQVGAPWVSDLDAQAFVNRVYTAGGTLSLTEANAVNQLTIDLKDMGLWTKMKAIYPMVGASAAACAQNLKSSSFTGTFTSGWTFASTGVTPNGSSAYMNTGLNPSANLAQNNISGGIYVNANATFGSNLNRTDVLFGASNSGFSNGFYLLPIASSDSKDYSRCNQNTALGFSSWTDPKGFFQMYRTSATGFVVKRNTTNSNYNVSSVSPSTNNVYIGALNNAGSLVEPTNNRIAFGYFGDGLTDTEASDFYTAVQDFQTTLSRQI